MALQDKESSDRGGAHSGCALEVSESKPVHVNGFAHAGENNGFRDGSSAGSSGDTLRTYVRRKRAKVITKDGQIACGSTSQDDDESVKVPWGKTLNKCSRSQASYGQMDPQALGNDTDVCSQKHWRNVVLEQMSQTLGSKGGLQGCIQDALVLDPQSCPLTKVKESVHSCEEGSKCTSPTGHMRKEFKNSVNANVAITSNGSLHESNCQTVTKLCQRTFSDVITSEKFSQLCHLLLTSFPGMKTEKVFDFSLINSRIQEGAYESSPDLFNTDVQQVWTKIHKIGMDMVALMKSLSELSRTSYSEQVRTLPCSSFEIGKHDVLTQDSDHDKADQTEACAVYTVCTCRHCGDKADGRSCLVCDSCEEMYHVSCIDSAVEEIAFGSWYCSRCTAKGIGSPHEECVVCERLNAPKSPNVGRVDDELNNEETAMELESSNGLLDEELQMLNDGEILPCNICRSEVENGENVKICRHPFCPHKFYHMRCLTRKQLSTYGPCWYCPSCLCRSCLTDCDDDKIVLCDGCDHAYHIFCMQPPRTSIPKGKWFCKKCEADIRRIRKAKKSYESRQHELKRSVEGNGSHTDIKDEQKEKESEALDKSVGVEMLLSAAKTLNYEENLASVEFKG